MKRLSPLNVRPEWMRHAQCAYVDPDLWFPRDKGDPGVQAKRICRRCPVQLDCLEYALDNDERHGIWGGRSSQERQRLRLPCS